MFCLKEEYKNGFDIIALADSITDTTVEIIPACGAMLHAFTVKDGNAVLNIIDSYSNKAEYDAEAESGGYKGLKLSPFPCRIQNASYSFNNKKYSFSKKLTNGSAIHGLLYNKPFAVSAKHADEHEASITLLHKYSGDDAGYPFTYSCEIIYSLKKNRRLTVTTNLTNTHNTFLPIADGWHPYFTFHKKVDTLELQFNSTRMLEFANLIPTGKFIECNDFLKSSFIGHKEIDNSFVLDFSAPQPMCILRDAASGWQLEISPDKSYPYLQIYIPPHRNSIAIENLSAPPDSFNNTMGLITLSPGEGARFVAGYCLSKID
ncbi:MAG: aldose 1-epimerase [Chitinophagaceae bacterium]|nr:aldose 1-epimerase [Chitinophagaceae bacterium]